MRKKRETKRPALVRDAAVEVVACWHRIVDSDELEEGMMSMKRRNWTKLSRCLE